MLSNLNLLHSKDKSKCLAYLSKLKAEPQITPFLQRFDGNLGYSDYQLILSKPIDLPQIEKNLKTNKYSTIKQFYKDLRQLFENYMIYCFEGDEVYTSAKKFYKLAHQQQKNHIPVTQYEQRVIPAQLRRETKPPENEQNKKKVALSQKIEMIYLLRSNEENFPWIKDVGESYKIGKMSDNQYVIRIEGNNWIELLKRN